MICYDLSVVFYRQCFQVICNVNWDATTMGCFPLPPSDYRALSPLENEGGFKLNPPPAHNILPY